MYSHQSFQAILHYNFVTKLSSKFFVLQNALSDTKSHLSNSKVTFSHNRPISANEFSQVYSKFISTMSTKAAVKSSCIFCNIVNKTEVTDVLYEDDKVCVFRDIKPATDFHILTIPKRHIEDVKSLTSEDKELVQHMLNVAQELLGKNNLSLEDARLGYHWPPFRSVKHLHLHTIAPESQMGMIGRIIFKKDSYWFVSPEYVASML